jgi:hypothetical protein
MSASFSVRKPLLHRDDQIRYLQQQAWAHQVNLQRANTQISNLTHQLAKAVQNEAEPDSVISPVDWLFQGILQNRSREPGTRRYSRDILLWLHQVNDTSNVAWQIIRIAVSDILLNDSNQDTS